LSHQNNESMAKEMRGNEDLEHAPVYKLAGGYSLTKNLALEGYVMYLKTEMQEIAGNPDMKIYGFGIEELWHFMPDKRLVPFLAFGVGNTLYDPSGLGDRNRLTFNYGGGLKFFLKENIALRGDVRYVIPFNGEHSRVDNNLLYTIGISFAFGGEPEVMTKRTATVAPVQINRDSDGDGVFDDQDKCPGTPEGVTVDTFGCPRPVQKVEPAAASKTEQIIREKGRVTLNVEFDLNKAVVKSQYDEEIGNLAAVMKKHPEIAIVIEGHTDSTGNAAFNKNLSQQRAEAVRKYLMEKFGIDGARLTATGYGESRPAASNATREGRQKNRRVEAIAEYFTIIKNYCFYYYYLPNIVCFCRLVPFRMVFLECQRLGKRPFLRSI